MNNKYSHDQISQISQIITHLALVGVSGAAAGCSCRCFSRSGRGGGRATSWSCLDDSPAGFAPFACCGFALAWRRRRPPRASCVEEAASLLAPLSLFVRKRVRACGGGFPQTFVAERLAKCCFPRCTQLFPDGCMLYAQRHSV